MLESNQRLPAYEGRCAFEREFDDFALKIVFREAPFWQRVAVLFSSANDSIRIYVVEIKGLK
jgi:hypothetical protein